MSHEDRSTDAAVQDKVENLPERPLKDASQVKGGASISTPTPTTPPPTSTPRLPNGGIRTIDPCW
jgi:hypothetical protein